MKTTVKSIKAFLESKGVSFKSIDRFDPVRICTNLDPISEIKYIEIWGSRHNSSESISQILIEVGINHEMKSWNEWTQGKGLSNSQVIRIKK